MRLPSGVTLSSERRERLQKAASLLNLHIAGAIFLLLVCLYLGVRLFLISSSTGTQGDAAIAAAQSRVAAAEASARQLRGLDAKLQASDTDAARFYADRLPFAYSDVAAQLGILSKATGVRLSRASYVQAIPVDGATELRIDASVTGEYRALAHFVNGLERDKSFFLIENMALSGAQSGLVNLQMRIGTYIREPISNIAAGQPGAGANR
ncbi:MAG: GspMb/PilO family protein [Janthinobacterium lividum]